MSEFSDPNGFRLGEVAEWCNQAGPGARPDGMPCVIVGPFDFYEGWNDAIGAVDFGFGYDVRDEDGAWFAFVRELRKRPPPGPNWSTLCKLDHVGGRMGGGVDECGWHPGGLGGVHPSPYANCPWRPIPTAVFEDFTGLLICGR